MLRTIRMLKAIAEFISVVADNLAPIVESFEKMLHTIKDNSKTEDKK